MGRPTDRDIFLRKLGVLSNDNNVFIPNATLQKELGWKRDKYQFVHSTLKAEGEIVVSRGRGGLLALSAGQDAKKLKVFVSYSHVDATLREGLVKHLRPLEREKLIEVWQDQAISAGDDWDQAIATNLEKADIVLALVSVDFINSKYCYDVELEKALFREREGKAKVIPVILRDCIWKTSPLGRLKALPVDGKPVSTWADTDTALTNVATGIRDSANELLEKKD